jgi:hypothetical protein
VALVVARRRLQSTPKDTKTEREHVSDSSPHTTISFIPRDASLIQQHPQRRPHNQARSGRADTHIGTHDLMALGAIATPAPFFSDEFTYAVGGTLGSTHLEATTADSP